MENIANNFEGIMPELAEKYAFESVNDFLNSMNEERIAIDKINILTKLAFHENKEISKRMIEPIFGVLVNNLKKSFKKKEGEIFLKVFPYFILAAKEKSKIVANWFEKMNILNKTPIEWLYSKSIELRKNKTPLSQEDKDRIKKVILLSRNTIGAEAYINGLIINRILETLTNAKILFIDSNDIGKHIFNHPKISAVTGFKNKDGEEISFKWNRQNMQILDRFEYTANLANYIETEISGLEKGEAIVIDADTRLSQTGAMLICDNSIHYFIETALENDEVNIEKVESFGILCNKYLNRIFNENKIGYPKIYLPKEDKQKAKEIREKLPKNKPVIMLHFGSGLKSKSLSPEFEKQLALESFKFGVPLIVKPPVDWELEKINRTIKFLNNNGKKEGEDFFTFNGPLSTFTSLIGEMDLCIVYDSQCQHMAAALEIPFITLFTGHINRIFLKRWTPLSKNFFRIIEIDKNSKNYEKEGLERAIECMKKFFKQ